MKEQCPVCDSKLKNYQVQHDYYFYECPRCGPYRLTYSADSVLNMLMEKTKESSAILSHAIYKATSKQQWASFNSELLKSIVDSGSLPSPHEQLENLVQWVGENQPSMGIPATPTDAMVAAVGVLDVESLGFICDYAKQRGLITHAGQRTLGGYAFGDIQLTFDGWNFLSEIQHGKNEGNMAFMAMQFGKPELDAIYNDHFKRAVEQTGFRLKRLDEGQPAGLIDDHLRVEIRQSKFVIADLTYHNKGAYWEAGFAEGLGKPVIYTCSKEDFDNGAVHFDTNHHLTVIWDPANLDAAVEKLKATIRATFPSEATLAD